MGRPVDLPAMHRWWPAWLLAIATACVAAYWPGLSGGFLFDDWVNLPLLGRYGGVHDWDRLLLFLTSGIADPTGRPIAQLSFLLDARDWPAEPWAFKRTNLALHLACGLALFSVLTALGRRSADLRLQRNARLAALVATTLWLAHPLWVSTVLYVVQRQAILAALFSLMGLRAWIASMDSFDAGRTARGWGLAVLAVPVFGLLAGLSKANGFLLPLLLAALQVTVLRGGDSPVGASGHRRLAALLFVTVPAVLVVAGIAWLASGHADPDAQQRSWSLWQRVLTQPRALVDYLFRLVAPGARTRGLFADDYQVSEDLLTPSTTLPALAAIVLLLASAWHLRRHRPQFSAAVLFYFAGHAMESSVIPLELYFEHRNYLPAALLAWPLVLACLRFERYRTFALAGPAGACALLFALVHAKASLWGDTPALARAWAMASPGSARAQAFAASIDADAGRLDAALARMAPLARTRPDDPQLSLALLDLQCRTGRVPPRVLANAERALSTHGVTRDVSYQWLRRTLSPAREATCSGLPERVLANLADAALAAPAVTTEHRARRARIQAYAALRRGDCPAALTAFDNRLEIQSRPEFAIDQIGEFATACGDAVARTHLARYLAGPAHRTQPMSTPVLRLRDRLLERQGFWDGEWPRLQALLSSDASSSNARQAEDTASSESHRSK